MLGRDGRKVFFFAKKKQKTFAYLFLPLVAASVCFAIILTAQGAAGFVPAAWQGAWSTHVVARQAQFVDRFFAFDAVWYQRIADDLYRWDPAQPLVKQDVAFFPLWPLLLRLVAVSRWAAVALAACFAAASICAFYRLALRLLPARGAVLATWLFALYPGASFLLLSYPTGLMNLLCCVAILALMDGKYWRAAACGGLVTAVGPLGLGTALAVCMCAAGAAPRTWRGLGWLAGVGLLSVSGLLAFLVWQTVKFGDPLAFIKAQAAWAAPLPWARRIPRAIVQLLIVPEFFAAVRELGHAARAGSLMGLQASLEKSLQLAAEGLALISLAACSRLAARPVLLQGGFTMALFIWFHSTSRPGNSTLRLTYCAIGMFLGGAWLLRGRPRAAACALCVSALLLAGGAFLTAAGYHVV